jgi:hypothetical protein
MKMPTSGNEGEINKFMDFIADKKRFIKKLGVSWVADHYGSSFFELMDIINKYDPIDLLSMGCPSNEYDLEIATIIVQLNHEMTVEEICEVVKEDFALWFGVSSVKDHIERYLPMATDIHEWLRAKGSGLNRYPTW